MDVIKIKDEPADDVCSPRVQTMPPEDNVRSQDVATAVKSKVDIGPTELQRAYYDTSLCKSEPGEETTQCSPEEDPLASDRIGIQPSQSSTATINTTPNMAGRRRFSDRGDDIPQVFRDMLEDEDSVGGYSSIEGGDSSKGDDSSVEDLSSADELEVNGERLEADEMDVAAHVDIVNMPILFADDEPMNVDVQDAGGDPEPELPEPEPELPEPELRDAMAQPAARGGGRGIRAQRHGQRRGRGRGRGRGWGRGRRPQGESWRIGEALEEVFPTDEDVPANLRDHVMPPANVGGAGAGARGRGRGRGRGEPANDRRPNEDDDSDDGEAVGLEDGGTIDDLMREYQECCVGDAGDFEWKSMGSWAGVKEMFRVERTGPTRVFQNAYDAFREIWDDTIIQSIVDSTNVYGDAIPETERTFHRYWYHTNAHEVLMFFAFWMMLAVIRMPTIKSCFSNHELLRTNAFRKMFNQNRYWTLNRALRFAPDETVEQNPDKLRHIRPILIHLNRKVKECYIPSQDVSIDESLTLWRGNVSFRYMKTKAAKFGIKTYELCEASTGYLWSFFIYTGKESEADPSTVKTVKIVLRLMLPLLGKGYRLFMDNFFNSPLLARFLKRKQTDVVGTLKRLHKHIPPLIKNYILPKGKYMARHADDVALMSLTDRKPLIVISTHHGSQQIPTAERPGRPSQYKFEAIADYNVGMGGVDKKDQMLEPYLVERKRCKRWFKKVFKRLLNATILNSRILVHKSGGSAKVQLAFRLELVEQIIQNHLQHIPKPPAAKGPRARGDAGFPVDHVVCDKNRFHAIRRIATPHEGAGREAIRRRCRWCTDHYNKRSRSVYECTVCGVALCLEPCFIEFHTQRP